MFTFYEPPLFQHYILLQTYFAQKILPQSLQWCFLSVKVNSTLHFIQLLMASSFSQCSIIPPEIHVHVSHTMSVTLCLYSKNLSTYSNTIIKQLVKHIAPKNLGTLQDLLYKIVRLDFKIYVYVYSSRITLRCTLCATTFHKNGKRLISN